MTTIAYRNGVLAADTSALAGGWIVQRNVRKVFRSKDGRLLGTAGHAGQANKLVQWLIRPPRDRSGEMPVMAKDIGQVLEVLSNGRLRIYEDDYWHWLGPVKFYAIGSGMPAALGAMHMGASARLAVRIAMKLDDSSNGKILSVRL